VTMPKPKETNSCLIKNLNKKIHWDKTCWRKKECSIHM